MLRKLLVLTLAASLGLPALAADDGEGKVKRSRRMVDEDTIVQSSGFLFAHPDLKNRMEGQQAYADGRYRAALEYFERAAWYGDKLSQAMLGEMHWLGTGTPIDPVKGYIWMDLAAERGYPAMLVKRERYWNALSAEERQRVLAEGPAYHDKYGHDVARQRLDRVLRRERRKVTGSRTGFLGRVDMVLVTPHGAVPVRAQDYYHRKFWQPDLYLEWRDEQWLKPLQGQVNVGELIQAAPRKDGSGDASAEGGE